MPVRTSILLVLLILFCADELHAQRTPPATSKALLRKLQRYSDSISARLDPRMQGALASIRSTERRLLAIRYYLEKRDQIDRKWAWSSTQVKEYRKSAAYAIAIDELARVRRMFEELNPGYQLGADIEIRSLGEQISKWNSVRSIGTGASELRDSVLRLMSDTLASYPELPDTTSLRRFESYLLSFKPAQHPTVAVPGFSQHGQMRAFDFRIKRGGRLVAGTSTATIDEQWDGPGWTDRLNDAVIKASSRFKGPLDEPYEPWHYEYIAAP